jgi:hypothetical protein
VKLSAFTEIMISDGGGCDAAGVKKIMKRGRRRLRRRSPPLKAKQVSF